MVIVRENPNRNWMITRGTLILGNFHVKLYNLFIVQSHKIVYDVLNVLLPQTMQNVRYVLAVCRCEIAD